MMAVMMGLSCLEHFLRSHVGTGSNSQDLFGALSSVFKTSSLLAGTNSDSGVPVKVSSISSVTVLLLLSVMFFRMVSIFDIKKVLKFSARSSADVCVGKHTFPVSPNSFLVSLYSSF